MAETVSLSVSVPVCCFRKGYAREYFETEELPPPSTVYGFLLSLIGEEDRDAHQGARIAYALLGLPELSVVLRTTWRLKEKAPPGLKSNRRPDYQELLTGLHLAVWVAPGDLAQEVRLVGEQPQAVSRYGGLSLGESRDLVNDITWSPRWEQQMAMWLVSDADGNLTLPIWVDHVRFEADSLAAVPVGLHESGGPARGRPPLDNH